MAGISEQGTLGMGFNKRDDKIVVASLPPSLPAQVSARYRRYFYY